MALYLDVADATTGRATTWLMDMGSPASLARLGWSKATVKAGDRIVVEGIPSRDGSPVGYPYTVTLSATGHRLRAAPPTDRSSRAAAESR
ncbi:MAG: hypothetical protein HYU37_15145 [Acidobacteria bacterium]|nr:hypothetical protein [Acidobacteriota bacterium]